MKKIFFLCSLPRAGNTVLGSIVNSNKNIKMSPNSICPDIINNLNVIKNSDIFQNFPNNKSLDNVIKNSIYKYYEDWEVENIIDRSQNYSRKFIFIKENCRKTKIYYFI